MLMKRLLMAIKNAEKAIQAHTEAIAEAAETANTKQRDAALMQAEIDLPKGVEVYKSTSDAEDEKKYQFRTLLVAGLTLIAVAIYAGISGWQLYEMQRATKATQLAAGAAQSAADTANASLVLGERPWLKIDVRISSPLTFGIERNGGQVAMMRLENKIENVGQSVAENVLSWEDIIPMDADHSTKTARARQKEWCDANRHPNPNGLSGYTLFPHDPTTEESIVGPTMSKVAEATIHGESGLNGKAAFILVGCVVYRSSFEKPEAPTHQTRFLYYLGVPQPEGVFQPYIIPKGTASDLRLMEVPDGFTAD